MTSALCGALPVLGLGLVSLVCYLRTRRAVLGVAMSIPRRGPPWGPR